MNSRLALTTMMLLGMGGMLDIPVSGNHPSKYGSSIPYKERGYRNRIKKLSKASKVRNRKKR